MVRVLDEAPDPAVVKRVTCGDCGVRLEYVPKDVLQDSWRDYGGGSAGHKFITCPKCSGKAVISSW